MLELPKVYGKDKAFVITSFIYILYVVFPLFADLTNIPVEVPALLVVSVITLLYCEVYNKKPVVCVFIYALMLIIYSLADAYVHINGINGSLPVWWRIMIEIAWILPPLLIAVVLWMKNDKDLFMFFGYGSLAILVISFIYILPFLITSKNILREAENFNEMFRPIGLPGYDLMHSYTLVLVPLCYMLRMSLDKKKQFLILFTLTVLFFYIVVQTAVTTSLIVSCCIFLFMFLYSEQNNATVILKLGFLGVLLYVLYQLGFFFWLVDALIPIFDGTAVSYKLRDFHDSMVSGSVQGESIIGRMSYHQVSKDAFFENPILGTGRAGGHSKILDILGSMGLLVFIPYFAIIWNIMKMQIFSTSTQMAAAFIVCGYFSAAIYLYEKGIFGAPGYLIMMVIVPSIIKAFESEDYEL